MTQVRTRGEQIRQFIIAHVRAHPTDISKMTAAHFNISRQAVNRHLQRMAEEKTLISEGKTRSCTYRLYPLVQWSKTYRLDDALAEDVVWRDDVAPALGRLPENASDIWHYGVTEMFNNAIDHSGGSRIAVLLRKDAASAQLALIDDGIGIFQKIRGELGLLDERHAILELAKGKLTTDPENHTGEGIFFTSRMFDAYDILSGGVYFSHQFGEAEDWILERTKPKSGTAVWMRLNNHTSRTLTKIFNQYTSDEDFGFNKTVVPVKFAQYGNDRLVSRSQAKRLLARIECFKTAIFDFTDVESIGQAFADEIFRVFVLRHPKVDIIPIKANSAVERMIHRASS